MQWIKCYLHMQHFYSRHGLVCMLPVCRARMQNIELLRGTFLDAPGNYIPDCGCITLRQLAVQGLQDVMLPRDACCSDEAAVPFFLRDMLVAGIYIYAAEDGSEDAGKRKKPATGAALPLFHPRYVALTSTRPHAEPWLD